MTKHLIEEVGYNSRQTILEKTLSTLKPERKIVIKYEQVSILKALERRTGCLVMTNYEILFLYDFNSSDSTADSNIFFFNWKQDA